VNPKVWVKSTTIATVFMPAGVELWLAALYIFAVTLLINFPSVSMWALFGVGIRRFLTSARRRFAFNATMAALLVATAALMVLGR
jgi:threonine/homoserine/homoserine lactone efflux protein